MNEFEKLQLQMQELQKVVATLQEQQRQTEQFVDSFSGKEIINHEVTFKQAVYNSAGTKVIN